MSLRTRLIIAFLLMSVVPLTAVTAFWYASAVRAFERAAERDATDTAADIGRRMELITADVGRRVDRLFVDSNGPFLAPSGDQVRARVAPMLGDAAALVDRVEFEPMTGVPAPPLPKSGSASQSVPRPPAPPAPKGVAQVPPTPDVPSVAPVPPPPPPTVIVVDIPKVMEEARRAAREGAAAAGFDMGAVIDTAIAASIPAAEAGLAAAAEAFAREARAKTDEARKLQMDINGRRVEIAIRRDGKLVGKANAVMNLERTLHTVLALARQEQGEIAFAVDHRGTLYTARPDQRQTLEQLQIVDRASAAANGSPQRAGDWIIVARRDNGGLLFGIARPIAESLREIRRMSFRNLSMGLGVIALACIGIVPLSRRMTQHVSSLSAGVSQLARGDFKTRVPVRSTDEFGALASAFNRMAEDLERHQALVVEQERLRRELELSRQIQTEMLPRASLRLGTAEIKGLSIPAREVGGDFFNYFALADGRLALLVGDVSGKGVSAALLMANVQATLRARLPLETDLARLADLLDREIDESTPRGVYLTLFLGILDVDGRKLRYVNAGHNPQFVLKSGGGILPLSSTGLPIALLPGKGYKESLVDIAPGDLLFFYTDGLVEAEDEKGDMFGAERLQILLEAEHLEGIDTVLERVERSVRAFRGTAEPFDDATMMALRVNT